MFEELLITRPASKRRGTKIKPPMGPARTCRLHSRIYKRKTDFSCSGHALAAGEVSGDAPQLAIQFLGLIKLLVQLKIKYSVQGIQSLRTGVVGNVIHILRI